LNARVLDRMRKLDLQHDRLQALLLWHFAEVDLKHIVVRCVIKQLSFVFIALLVCFPLL